MAEHAASASSSSSSNGSKGGKTAGNRKNVDKSENDDHSDMGTIKLVLSASELGLKKKKADRTALEQEGVNLLVHYVGNLIEKVKARLSKDFPQYYAIQEKMVENQLDHDQIKDDMRMKVQEIQGLYKEEVVFQRKREDLVNEKRRFQTSLQSVLLVQVENLMVHLVRICILAGIDFRG
jgi:hypothetical protein